MRLGEAGRRQEAFTSNHNPLPAFTAFASFDPSNLATVQSTGKTSSRQFRTEAAQGVFELCRAWRPEFFGVNLSVHV